MFRVVAFFAPVRVILVLQMCSLLLVGLPLEPAAQPVPPGVENGHHDGSSDFDFEVGRWHTRLRRLVKPFSGSSTWVAYEGTSRVRQVWEGRANLLELDVSGPAGHIEALSLRLFNPRSHQWSLSFASRAAGSISAPPTIGEFKNGRGEFFDQETFNGRAILVRFVISDITSTTCHFEQAFSDDGGKTWEVNWIADDARIPEERDATG